MIGTPIALHIHATVEDYLDLALRPPAFSLCMAAAAWAARRKNFCFS